MNEEVRYYLRLVIGAEFLAERSANGPERAEHLKMAEVYRRRAGEATVPARTIH
jgi:hypothetical protein